MNFSISDTLDAAWKLAKKYGLPLALILFIVQIVVTGLGHSPAYWAATFSGNAMEVSRLGQEEFGRSLLSNLVVWIFSVGMCNTSLHIVRGESTKMTLDHFKLSFKTYSKILGYTIVSALAISVGFLLLILPGLYLMTRLWMGTYYLIEHPEASISEAFKVSWQATKGSELKLIGFILACIAVALSGALLCCIGFFFTGIISSFASALAYLQFKDRFSSQLQA